MAQLESDILLMEKWARFGGNGKRSPWKSRCFTAKIPNHPHRSLSSPGACPSEEHDNGRAQKFPQCLSPEEATWLAGTKSDCIDIHHSSSTVAPCWDTKKKFIWLGWAIASLATVPGGTWFNKEIETMHSMHLKKSLHQTCFQLDFHAMCNDVQCACAGSFPLPLPLPLSSFPFPLSSFPLEAETAEVIHRLCHEKSEESALPPPFSEPCSIQRRV